MNSPHSARRRAPRLAWTFVSLGVWMAVGASAPSDSLATARRDYVKESRAAGETFTKKLVSAAARLTSAYDHAIRDADSAKQQARAATLRKEQRALAEALERFEAQGPNDPLAELLARMEGVAIPPSVPPGDLLAYFGLNEGLGIKTMDAVSKRSCDTGAAVWAEDDGHMGLDFRPASAALTPLEISTGPEWTALVHVRFPLENAGHEWSSLFVSRPGLHPVIVSSSGELGVFRDDYHGSGVNVQNLSGWHWLAIRAASGRTSFFIDWTLRGTAPAAGDEPIRSIGNGPWSAEGNYQNFGALLDGVAIYGRAFADEELARMKLDEL